jgi:hypothetical protein
VRAGRERAAGGELDPCGPELAAEYEHLHHLAGRLRGADSRLDRVPELVEAVGPGAAFALLAQRERARERAGLDLEQLEVVVQLRAGAEAAPQPLMTRDLAPAMAEHDLPGADPRRDTQTGEPDRQ